MLSVGRSPAPRRPAGEADRRSSSPGSAAGLTIFVIAGEPSGDALGGRLMAALVRKSETPVRFVGVGGPAMMRSGLEPLFPMDELAIMGLVEVVRHVPRMLRLIDRTAQAIENLRPDAVLTIDAPAFTLRVAKKVRRLGIPVIHYVAPTVWAWRPRRAKKLAGIADHLIALLPFEPPYFECHGLGCSYVGYPAVEDVGGGDGAAFRQMHGLTPDDILLCAMPGSRKSEIRRLMPIYKQAIALLAAEFPNLKVTIPTVPNVAGLVREYLRDWSAPVMLVEQPEQRRHLFAASDVALVKSGTSAVELAAAKVPIVVTQKLSYISVLIFVMLSKIRFVSIINLMAQEEVQLERLQHRCRPKVLSRALRQLLLDRDGTARAVATAYEMAVRLGADGEPPSEKAAEAVLAFLSRRARSRLRP